MNQKILILGLVGILILPAFVLANEHHQKGGGIDDMYFGKARFYLAHQDELGLSKDQVEKITAMKYDVKRASVEANAKKDLAMIDFKQELHTDKPDLTKLEAAIDQKMAAKTDLYKKAAKAIVDTKALLSADQTVKAKELYRQKKSDWKMKR